ncbi:hypothetical protein C2R22_19495 [Salinigranum rubrum]|uniref:SHOCT domain-containing protein n=1 Tax=Salinigranum rubrum TaxID=755307 RepID=A0A2I8VNQ0_9EURY|nr:SHOCT domain-containing protein [Salinigranum rubrum]AUV83557.1 hypothetical protein C2R22_19495 [Salinigranum rubrum]
MRPFRPPHPRHGGRATGVASLLVLGVGLTALFLGYGWFWVVFVVGFAVVVPIVSILAGEGESETDESPVAPSESTGDDPLETLRERYARGDLTEEQFERKLEALLETETLEAAEDRARRRGRERVGADDRPSTAADTETEHDTA